VAGLLRVVVSIPTLLAVLVPILLRAPARLPRLLVLGRTLAVAAVAVATPVRFRFRLGSG